MFYRINWRDYEFFILENYVLDIGNRPVLLNNNWVIFLEEKISYPNIDY